MEDLLNDFNNLSSEFNDLVDLNELFKTEHDEKIEAEIINLLKNTLKASNELKIKTLLSSEADGNDCFIEINAGAGGTESQDWTNMLSRMYNRWSDKNFKKTIMNINNGDEAGIKSITIKVEGENAYGPIKV